MDKARLQHLAGVQERPLMEEVQFGENPTIEQVMAQMDAARRALGIVNTMKDPDERRKHLRQVFVGMNKIRAMLARLANVADDDAAI